MSYYHRELLRLAKDPAAVRELAKKLLAVPDAQWTDWETDFLANMAECGRSQSFPRQIEILIGLSMRQREKLAELRDSLERLTDWRGLSIKSLIDRCYFKISIDRCNVGRNDLDEGDDEFVANLMGRTSIQRRHLRRLLRCSHQLGLIEEHMA